MGSGYCNSADCQTSPSQKVLLGSSERDSQFLCQIILGKSAIMYLDLVVPQFVYEMGERCCQPNRILWAF